MPLTSPRPPPFDLAEWAEKSFEERARLSVQSFGIQGGGAPFIVYAFYLLKLGLYYGGWVFFCSFTDGLGSWGSIDWWMQPIAFQKAITWSMLYEVLGLGCGSGPLTSRFKPPIGGFLYWLRPGTTKLPFFEGAPFIGTRTRTPFDVLTYVALLACLVRALVSPEPGLSEWLPVIVLVPVLGMLDKPLFLATRAEHYWVTIIVFAFAGNWIAGAMAVQLALWFFAGVSKLNHHFPTVVAVMTSNSPLMAIPPLRRAMYRSYPDDMRPSRLAALQSHGGTFLELGVPTVMLTGLLLGEPRLVLVALVMMVMLHSFILSTVPVGVPIEWNFMVLLGGFFLFGQHPDVTPLEVGSLPVAALLVTTCLVLPIVGNFFPSRISFLLSMRYYAGNWATSIYLFRGDAHTKLEKLTKTSGWIEDQLRELQDEEDEPMIQYALGIAQAFRLLHLHGRAHQQLVYRAVDDVEAYKWVEGELVAGVALGWNFGEGHLHDEQLVRSLQAQCGFEPGELRCVFLESQPLFGDAQQYRIYDAATGELESGEVKISDMRERQPWPVG